MMVKKSEKYTVYLEECRVYSSGTYKILFCVKSIHGNISICMNPENQYKEVEDGTFVLEKVFEQGKKVQPISLRDVEITVSIDTGLNESPIYLHVKILKLNCEGPSIKNDNFEEYSCGKILLQPHRRLFQTVEESYVERKYNGTLHFFTLLENELVKVAAGCMKYSFFFKKVEECEEAEVPVEEEVTIEVGKEDEEDVEVLNSNRNCTPTGLTEENTSAEIPSTQRLIPINESLQDSWERNDGHQSVASLREKNNPSAYRERQNIPINEKNKIEDLHRNALELDIGFPDMNAIKNLLPQYHALQLSPRLHASSVLPHIPIQEPHNTEERSGTPLSLHNPFILSPKTKEELDSHVVAVLDYQTKELDRFREVIQRMGDDIINLRKEIAKLQHEKSQLVAKLYYAGEGLTYQNEGDENSNSEIVLLKRRLVAEYEVKTELQERVHSLQNDIIKKNEISVSYVQLQTAHELQQKSLQQMQTKMKKCKLMEDTVMKQEQVIEELERKIAEMKAERRAVSGNDGRVKRSSLKKITVGKPSEELNIGKNQLQANVDSIEEKVRMMQRLEQAEGTICALEEQLYNNTRKWATERSMMQRSIGNQQQPQKFLPSNYENVQQYQYQPTNRPQNTLQFPPYTYQQRRNKYD